MSDKHIIVTIAREYGSGGHDIGKLMAGKLGLPFYDKELIERAAEKSGFSRESFENAERVATSPFEFALNAGGTSRQYGMSLNDQLFAYQSSVIREIAEQGSAVIVGRCADLVLVDSYPLVRLFIGADIPSRVKECMRRDGLGETEAKKFVAKMDKYRSTYYNFYSSGAKWSDRRAYDFCLNRKGMDDETAAELLAACVRIRMGAIEKE